MDTFDCSVVGCNVKVFASGKCRKHYERDRLATAGPCSFPGCTAHRFRGLLCQTHYRAKKREGRPECIAPGCTDKQHTLKSQLCEKHLFRFSKHNSYQNSRPNDWGARESHPSYGIWAYHRRRAGVHTDPTWAADFWVFVDAVGIRPANHTLRKIDPTKLLGPGNWVWKEMHDNSDKPKYQQKWRRRNPERTKHHELKKKFGISFDEYSEMGNRQKWRCAICDEKETAVDRNGVPRFLAVDHNHDTGVIRSLLCGKCNVGLGAFNDDLGRLQKAIKYLEKHSSA